MNWCSIAFRLGLWRPLKFFHTTLLKPWSLQASPIMVKHTSGAWLEVGDFQWTGLEQSHLKKTDVISLQPTLYEYYDALEQGCALCWAPFFFTLDHEGPVEFGVVLHIVNAITNQVFNLGGHPHLVLQYMPNDRRVVHDDKSIKLKGIW